ncbi:hypothetical protein [Tellurirhabdus bombi]|uniref:hypothetical protein n=1 Tax=Tellurirhabdus bombi TaxID=2907205 RepID=UPI001F4451DD|nr:hypothetical protein [Tellurirhabdus bombi]
MFLPKKGRQLISHFVVFLTLLQVVGCASQKPLTAEMALRTIKANNLEETISRKDEVMIAYSLTAFNSQNQLVGAVNNAWGIQTMTKGMSTNLASQSPIQLEIPKNGKVVASLVLIEVDDYEATQALIKRIQQVNQWVQVPAGFLALAVEALTPLRYVTLGLTAAGLGVQLTDRLDQDDLLGQSSVELKDADLQSSKQSQLSVPAHFTGQHLRDSFDYELEYDIRLKRMRVRAKDRK